MHRFHAHANDNRLIGRSLLALAGLVGLALLFLVAVALGDAVFAATAAPTVIDVGANVSAVLAWARDILLAVAGIVVSFVVPLPLRVFVTNNMLERAVDYAIAQVEGAAKGKVLDVTTTNDVLNEAIAYVLAMGPKMAKRLGEKLKPMLLARLAKTTPLTASSANVPVDPAGL